MSVIQRRNVSNTQTYAWIDSPQGDELARLTLDHLTMHVEGGDSVSVAAVGNVFTAQHARGQGLAGRLMHAVGDLAPDAALAVLFGIDRYYLRFGYLDAGDEWLFNFAVPDAELSPLVQTIHAADPATLERVCELGERVRTHLTGCMTRTPSTWAILAGLADPQELGACRTGSLLALSSPDGELQAAAWLDDDHDVARGLHKDVAVDVAFISELIAADATSANQLIAHIAATQGKSRIAVSDHPRSAVAQLARIWDTQITRTTRPSGGTMARVLRPAECLQAGLGSTTEQVCESLRDRDCFIPLADRW